MDMFKNNKYNFSAFLLYMAYFLHGIQAIVLSQNAAYFADRWGADVSGVFGVIAWTGIGKITFLIFSGVLADKLGRKPIVITGVIGYCILFGSLIFTRSLGMANVLSFIGGAATSLFDGSVNPAIMEIYPRHKSTASIFNKGTISISGIIYPLLVGYLITNNMPQEIALWIPFIIAVALLVVTIFMKLPDSDLKKEKNVSAAEAVRMLEQSQSSGSASVKKVNKPKMSIEGVILPIFAFTIYSTFYLFQQVVSIYAVDVVAMSEVGSRAVASYYQAGSFAAVILSAVMMARGIRDMALLTVYPLLAGVAALVVYFVPTSLTLSVAAAVIGFAAAGGALQMGNALLNQFFDQNKGRNTSIYFFVMSLGSYIMPTVAAYLRETNFTLVMLLVAGVAFLSFVLMLILGVRYKHIFGKSAFDRSGN